MSKTIEEKIERRKDKFVHQFGVDTIPHIEKGFNEAIAFAAPLYEERGFRRAVEFLMGIAAMKDRPKTIGFLIASLRDAGIESGILPKADEDRGAG